MRGLKPFNYLIVLAMAACVDRLDFGVEYKSDYLF
jgi:hypothetical protein